MNYRKTIIASALLTAVCCLAYADQPQFQQGETFISQSQPYNVIQNLYARPYNSNQSAVPVTTKGNYGIYSDGAGETGAPHSSTTETLQRTQSPGTLAVVQNQQTGNLGVVLGNIIFKHIESIDIETLQADLNIHITSYAPGPRIAIVTVAPPDITTLIALRKVLLGDSRIMTADLEILEHINIPQ